MDDVIDRWQAYWERQSDTGARLQLERAARQPDSHWLIADCGVLVDDEIGLDIDDIQASPDETFEAARTGFARFVADSEIDRDPGDGYDHLPIHLVGLPTVDGSVQLDSPFTDANTLTTIPKVTTTTWEQAYRPISITYRCPADHETTVDQPSYRSSTLTHCGEPDCTNEVDIEDRRTRVRRFVEFEVEYRDRPLRCVGTGRTAQSEARFRTADRVHLTGIPRLSTATKGRIEPVYELVHVGPA